MARFRAIIKGARGEASRLGNADTGLSTTVNGWNLGVHVVASAYGPDDAFDVYMTGGSNDAGRLHHIGQVRLTDYIPTFTQHGASGWPEPPPAGRVVNRDSGAAPAPGAPPEGLTP